MGKNKRGPSLELDLSLMREYRDNGMSYAKIGDIFNISTSTVLYYLDNDYKKKANNRATKKYWNNPLKTKIVEFKSKSTKDFINFSDEDVKNKIGENPKCYLTGRKIDIYQPNTYQLDHILPRSRGGDNSIDNLGILCREANQAKNDRTKEEHIQYCKEVLEYQGYKITKEN